MMDRRGFPWPAQIGPRGRKWLRSAVTQWALKQQLGGREAVPGSTQTRPAERVCSDETRPAE